MPKSSVLVGSHKCAVFIALLLVGLLFNSNAFAVLNAGTIGSNQTICSGSTPAAFTSITPASNGIGTYNYQWQQSTTSLLTGYSDIVGATSITYTPGVLTQTTYYRRAVSTLDDAVVYSDPITITVNPGSTGGTIYLNRNSCSGTDLTILTLVGNVGNVIGWESATSNVSPVWVPIANTTNVLTISNFATTTYYRAIVQNGTCTIQYSSIVNTVANPAVSNGWATTPPPGTICGGINSSLFTLVAYTGTILYWQSSPTPNFSSPTTIPGTANLTQYTAVNLNTTTYFRAALSTGSCGLIYSVADGKEVNPPSIGGNISGGDTVCSGTNTTNLTLSGHSGTILRWESSTTSNFSSITTIANTTTTYAATNISQTTYYRAVVKRGSCPEAYSSTGIVLIDPNTAIGGTISGGGTYCTSAASLLITLTAYTGTIVKWQAASDAAFTNILFDINVTTPTLSVGRPLPFTRYYRAVVIGSVCSAVNSAVTEIIIVDQTVAGTTSGGTTHCTTTNNTNITLSGHTGSILRWESSANSNFIPKSTIANTTSTLPISNLTATTYYRAVVRSGTCDSLFSTSSLITILTPASVGNMLGSDTLCSSVNPNSTVFTLSSFSGSISKWQSSTSSTFANSVTDIVNTTNTYTATNITTTTYYRAIVTSGSCVPDTSNYGVVFIYPATVGGSVFGNNPFNPNVIVCTGTNSSTLVLTGQTGSVVRWQSCLNSNFTGTITNIANTTTSYTATNLTTTTYYRAIVKSGECDSAISAVRVITVNPISDGGILVSDTVCIGSNSTTLRLTNYVGSIVKWESSAVSNFSSGVTNIANTTDSLVVTNLSSTTYYRVVVKSGVCSADTSNIAHILVNSAPAGGTLSGGGHFCPTVAFPVLFLTGQVGTILRWEQSTVSNFSSNVTVINFTSTNYSTTILTPSTFYYRAVIGNGVCPIVYSTIDTIIIDSASVGGTITGGAGVCSSTNSTTLTLTGYTGTIVKWQSSTSPTFSNSIVDIVNTTNTYTATNVTVATYYRAVVKSGTCSSVNSSIASILITAPTVGGTISGPLGFCRLINSSTLTLSTHVGTIIEWQSSTTSNFSSNVTSIPNTASLTSLTITNLSTTTYYRVLLQNGTCASAFSSIKVLSNLGPFPVAGTISGPSSLCIGTNNGTLTLTGFSGSVLKWQSSAVSNFSSGVTDIANTTNTLNIVNLGSAMYYRAIVFNGPIACEDTTAAKQITIDTKPIAGTLNGSDSICATSTINSTLLTLTGFTGTIVKWQSSTSPTFASGVVDIVNTTNTHTAVNISTTTYFRAIVSNGVCDPDTSTVGTVFVYTASIGGSVFGNNPFNPDVIVCTGINSSTLILTGYTGSIVKWQSATSPTFSNTIVDIANTTSSYTATNLSTTTYYRVIVKNGECDTAISAIRVITVNPISDGGILKSDTVCAGINSTTLHLTNYVGSIVKWESSSIADFSSGVASIPNSTDSLVVTNLSTTTYYRAIVKSGVCSADTSNIVHILVNSSSAAGSITGATTVCAGVNNVQLQLNAFNGTIIKWQSSTNINFTTNVVDINTTIASISFINLTTTTYVRVLVKHGICDADTSLTVAINVDVPSDAGLLLNSDTVCSGLNSTTLHLINYVGSIVKWESSPSANFSSGVTNIANTTDSLVINNLSSTTYYRVIVKSGVCETDTSIVVHIIVTNGSSAGIISGATTVCAGINNVQLQLSSSTGTIVKWQRSTSSNFSSNVIDINNTNAIINIINLTATTYVRVMVKNGICDADTSLVVVINVDVPSDAGLLLKSDTVCAGASSTTLQLINNNGSIVKWESSSSADFSSGVTSISNTTNSLLVNNLSSTTYYRVIVKSGVCAADTSNIVFIRVFNSAYSNIIYQPQPDSFLVSGDPNNIIGSTVNTDSVFYAYQWQLSTISDSTGFTSIPGANARDYNPSTINQTTWYRRILFNPYCFNTDTSNIVIFVIVSDPVNSNPIIGISKSVLKPKVIAFGSYHIQYTITVENFGNTDLNNIRVIENLTSVFPSPAVFSLVSVSSGSSLTVNSNFDGVTNLELLDPAQSSLNIGESSTITFKVLLNPNLPNVTYTNQVLVYADVVNGSSTVVDTSVNGDNPDPNGDGNPEEDSPTPVTIAVFVPSGYSPNGDGKNDEFIIVGLENYPNNKLEIYNRWGNKVFEQAPYDNTWKGSVKNIDGYIIGEGLLPSGTYFYLLDFGVPGVEQLTGYIVIRK